MEVIIWGDEPREVPGLGLMVANQEVRINDEVAKQLISQGFAEAKRKPRKKTK